MRIIIALQILLFFWITIIHENVVSGEDRANKQYVVEGASLCRYFIRASDHAKKIDPSSQITGYSWGEWPGRLKELQNMFGKQNHNTSPVVYSIDLASGMKEWIGGCDEFISKLPVDDSYGAYL